MRNVTSARWLILLALVMVIAATTPAAATTYPESAPQSSPAYTGSKLTVSPVAPGVVRAQAVGTLVYDNGSTDPATDSGNEMSHWIQADDFELASATSISEASVDWFEFTLGNWDGTIEWFIFADSGGSPGALIDSGTGTEESTTDLGTFQGWVWHTTDFAFDHAVSLSAGTRYWFGIHWGAGYVSRDDVYFAYSSAQAFNYSQESENGTMDNWATVTSEDRGFRLFAGAVPSMPETALALLAFLLLMSGVLLTSRRMRAQR